MIVYMSSVSEFPKNLLNHILQYYTSKGVDKFYFTVYGGEGMSAWHELEFAAQSYNIEFHANDYPWSTSNDSDYKNVIRQTLSPDDWIIPADIDEFHWHPTFDNFKDLGRNMGNFDFVRTTLVDRVTVDGHIPEGIEADVPLMEQFPINKFITRDIMGAYTTKMIMSRPNVVIGPGHHYLHMHRKLRRFKEDAVTFHFKWFGNIRNKERLKIQMYKNADTHWYVEQERLFKHLDQHSERL